MPTTGASPPGGSGDANARIDGRERTISHGDASDVVRVVVGLSNWSQTRDTEGAEVFGLGATPMCCAASIGICALEASGEVSSDAERLIQVGAGGRCGEDIQQA